MDFRLAVMRDLPGIQTVYEAIIQKMNREQIQIWDEVYPCSFFEADIQNQRLYILLNSGDIVAAFALCGTNAGETSIAWQDSRGKALYLDRLGVNTDYVRSGLGSLMLEKAKETAKNLGAESLRLFGVDINEPAIRLYQKNGFTKGDGTYDEVIDSDLTLREYGFEIKL